MNQCDFCDYCEKLHINPFYVEKICMLSLKSSQRELECKKASDKFIDYYNSTQ